MTYLFTIILTELSTIKRVSASDVMFLVLNRMAHIFLAQLSIIKSVSASYVMFLIACCIEPYDSSLYTFSLLNYQQSSL